MRTTRRMTIAERIVGAGTAGLVLMAGGIGVAIGVSEWTGTRIVAVLVTAVGLVIAAVGVDAALKTIVGEVEVDEDEDVPGEGERGR